jgi:hypothetical protein
MRVIVNAVIKSNDVRNGLVSHDLPHQQSHDEGHRDARADRGGAGELAQPGRVEPCRQVLRRRPRPRRRLHVQRGFVVEDLDGLFAYLTHPATFQTDHLGLHLVERLEIFDVSDDDPDLNAEIQELHRRRNELNPQIAGMLADVPTYTGSGVAD